MKKLILLNIIWIFLISIISMNKLHADEGEVTIADETEEVSPSDIAGEKGISEQNLKDSKTFVDSKTFIEINKVIKSFETKLNSEIMNEIKNLIQNKLNKMHYSLPEKKLTRTLDDEIDDELTKLFNKFKSELTADLRKEIKNKISRFITDYEKIKHKPKIITRSKTTKRKATISVKKKKLKYYHRKKVKKHKRIKKQLYIKSIKVGINQVKKAGKGIKTPIVVTVKGNHKNKFGKLNLYAKEIKSGKVYLIYQIKPFQMTNNIVSQDQLIWDGSYFEKKDKKYLPSGKYKIFCVLSIINSKNKLTKKIISYWGKGRKRYYVNVISEAKPLKSKK
ncbi:MAG: hypothetical protein OEV44_14720 [Spirochaetota bacterium]|nr:hypothetical protein [Spirochaetota bacterium]